MSASSSCIPATGASAAGAPAVLASGPPPSTARSAAGALAAPAAEPALSGGSAMLVLVFFNCTTSFASDTSRTIKSCATHRDAQEGVSMHAHIAVQHIFQRRKGGRETE